MMSERIFNFSAGPSQLPFAVLNKAKEQLLNYEDSGMSVMEMSHRSPVYQSIIDQANQRLRTLLNIPSNYKVLFLQGGATMQFSMVPMNLLKKQADYIVSGYFSNNAYKEAKKFGQVNLAASSEDKNYSYIPKQADLKLNPDSDYVYLCENNTIYGSEFHYVPNTGNVPIVADMSSDILSKEIDVSKYGIIFAGAQKNMGIAGVTCVIIRDDLIHLGDATLPVMLNYGPLADKDSMYNTPPAYAIYVLGLVLEWIENSGGIKAIEKANIKKANLLYDYLDASSFYHTQVAKEDRSNMNVTFTTGDADLDALFAKESKAAGLSNLKGHRAVGGMRASIYNAMPMQGVEALIAFMGKFKKEHEVK
ncbi:MAG: 3-phosphoserine/phosphohydroxythreonine transaminase [Erysipelotrichaceae bacterium]